MPEHVCAPFGSAELVVDADRCDEVCAVLERGIRDGPGVTHMVVGVFNTNTGAVGFPVTGVPGGVSVPHELADTAVHIDLVVSASLAGLPHIPALLNGEASGATRLC